MGFLLICNIFAYFIALPTVLAVALALIYYYVKVVKPKCRHLEIIPAIFPHMPLLGSSPYFKSGPEFRDQLLDFCYHQHGPEGICVFWLSFHPVVAIWKAEYVETLLSGHEIKKSYLYNFAKPWLGEGLLTGHGEHWYQHRKLLTPSFHFRILNDFVPVMNEHAEHLVQMLDKHIDIGEVDIFPLITMTTLNVICEAAMGQVTGDEDRKARARVFSAVIELSHAIQRRQTKPYLWPDVIFAFTPTGKIARRDLKIIHDYTDKIFRERLETFDKAAVGALMTSSDAEGFQKYRRPLPFLDSLLYSCENFTKLTVQDIKDEGHDTTAASTAWTVYLLARHPEVQRKVHEELDAIFGSSNRPITVEDIRAMRYLSACLKESLRLYPVAPIYARELTGEIKFGDYLVPSGTTVLVLNEILHRDPVYFDDPLQFKPERFFVAKDISGGDDEIIMAGGKVHPFAYVPFSAGQRNCIGQKYAQLEDKIMLASIFRRFSIECDYSEEDLAPAVEVILRPTKGIFVRVHYR